MILTGPEIIKQYKMGNINLTPFNKKNVGPNSIDVTLSDRLAVYNDQVLDMKKQHDVSEIKITDEGYTLQPNRLYLGMTNEFTGTDKYVMLLEGRSSIGRLGISIHSTAGFGDLGFSGTWTLEISCIQPVKIYPNIRIGQIYFLKPEGDVKIYSGKYNGQAVPVPSKLWRDF